MVAAETIGVLTFGSSISRCAVDDGGRVEKIAQAGTAQGILTAYEQLSQPSSIHLSLRSHKQLRSISLSLRYDPRKLSIRERYTYRNGHRSPLITPVQLNPRRLYFPNLACTGILCTARTSSIPTLNNKTRPKAFFGQIYLLKLTRSTSIR